MNWPKPLAILGISMICAPLAHATEPDGKAIACLTSVLRSAPNAVSVTTAKDIELQSYVPHIARGVDYTFKRPDGTMMTVGVYLSTQFKVKRNEECQPPQCIETAMSVMFEPANNGRFGIFLREPYPPEWYPLAKLAYAAPNETRYLKRDSPDHPLYAVWYPLMSKCKADNLNINSGVVP